jgi:hypothetical protein
MTNILNLLAELHTAGVRVSLLDNYNPANLLEKADENQQTVRFRQTVQFYPIPEYTISSAANLNIKFALVGKAVDTLHEKKEYDAVQFKTVSIVKNGKIFKESLNICPDDIQKVRDMGYDVDNNGVIDLTKFDLEDGVDFDNAAFAKSVVEQYIYDAMRTKATRGPKVEVELPAEKAYLIKNGYNPDTGVWQAIITSTEVRVKNTKTDCFRAIVNGLKTTPSLKDAQNRVAEGKTLNAAAQAIYDLAQTGYNFSDHSLEVNTGKYVLIARGQQTLRIVEDVIINGVTFHVEIN